MSVLQGQDVAWFAARIRMSESWVRANVRGIQHNKVGGRLRFTEEDVAAFWEQHRRTPESELSPDDLGPVRLQTSKRARTQKRGGS